jgi:hypothetical protein
MKTITVIALILILSFTHQVNAQIQNPQAKSGPDHKFSVFTTWLSFSNFGKPETNTHHYEIQARYHLTDKDAVGFKAATWKLFAPMGIHIWDDSFLDEDSFYPGRLRETGFGLTYQRKWWKGLFTTLEVMPKKTTYLDEEDHKIGSGFKLYNSYHIGYHVKLFKNKRIFIEPQFHVNHWPVNTNVPEAFRVEENKWGNYFLIEPNLYLGIKF